MTPTVNITSEIITKVRAKLEEKKCVLMFMKNSLAKKALALRNS